MNDKAASYILYKLGFCAQSGYDKILKGNKEKYNYRLILTNNSDTISEKIFTAFSTVKNTRPQTYFMIGFETGRQHRSLKKEIQ